MPDLKKFDCFGIPVTFKQIAKAVGKGENTVSYHMHKNFNMNAERYLISRGIVSRKELMEALLPDLEGPQRDDVPELTKAEAVEDIIETISDQIDENQEKEAPEPFKFDIPDPDADERAYEKSKQEAEKMYRECEKAKKEAQKRNEEQKTLEFTEVEVPEEEVFEDAAHRGFEKAEIECRAVLNAPEAIKDEPKPEPEWMRTVRGISQIADRAIEHMEAARELVRSGLGEGLELEQNDVIRAIDSACEELDGVIRWQIMNNVSTTDLLIALGIVK